MAIPSYNHKTWVSDLSKPAKELLLNKYKEQLLETGHYTTKEIDMYSYDLLNEKLSNIVDTFGKDFILKLTKMY